VNVALHCFVYLDFSRGVRAWRSSFLKLLRQRWLTAVIFSDGGSDYVQGMFFVICEDSLGVWFA